LAFFRVVPEKRALLALRYFHFRFGEKEMIRKCGHAYATTKGLTGRFASANRRWEGRAAESF
jgi:hypothetical protein